MNKCKLVQKLLLAYQYGLLNEREKKELEIHLKDCPDCAAKLEKIRGMQKSMAKEPALTAMTKQVPNDLALILAKARKLESEKKQNVSWAASLMRSFLDSRAVRLTVAGALAAAVIFVVALWFTFNDVDYLYMTRAFGDVKVNDKPLYVAKNFIFRMEVSRPVKIGVGEGECEFQINQNKYLELKPLTRVLVDKGKDIIIHFLEGMMIGKVVKQDNARGLQIQVPNQNAIFQVIGTLFFVRSTNQVFEFAVKEGEVRNTISNRSYTIRGSEIMRIGKDYAEIIPKSPEQQKKIDKVFDKLDQYSLKKDFSSVREIVIKTDPPGSDIYYKDKLIGKSPLYVLGNPDEYRSVTVVRKGYTPKQVDIGNGREFNVSIHQEIPAEISWNLGRKDTRFVNPVMLGGNHLLVSDESGWLYRLDIVKKTEMWKFPASLRNNSLPLVVSNTVYFSSSDENLYAVGIGDGKLLWKQKAGMLVYSGPQYHDGAVYTGNIEGMIMAMDPSTGRVIWTRKFDDGFYTSPLISGKKMYIGAMSGNLYALDVKTGEVVWQFRAGDRIVGSRPIIRGNRLFFGSNDRNFYALDARTGKLLWRVDTGGEIFTSPLDIGDSILVCTVKGDILCLDINQGELLWKYRTGNKILLNPEWIDSKYIFVSAEKNLYVLSRYGILFQKVPFEFEISDFTVNANRDVFICGGNGDLKNIRLSLD